MFCIFVMVGGDAALLWKKKGIEGGQLLNNLEEGGQIRGLSGSV